jgi:hypothetical protein
VPLNLARPRFRPDYHRQVRWVIVVPFAVVGSFMVFDGLRALVVGDYLTPSGGEYEGQLGPWSTLVEAVGIPARSTAMKILMATVGGLHLSAALALASGAHAAAALVPIAAVSGLWYLPFGTAADVAVLLVWFSRLRPDS